MHAGVTGWARAPQAAADANRAACSHSPPAGFLETLEAWLCEAARQQQYSLQRDVLRALASLPLDAPLLRGHAGLQRAVQQAQQQRHTGISAAADALQRSWQQGLDASGIEAASCAAQPQQQPLPPQQSGKVAAADVSALADGRKPAAGDMRGGQRAAAGQPVLQVLRTVAARASSAAHAAPSSMQQAQQPAPAATQQTQQTAGRSALRDSPLFKRLRATMAAAASSKRGPTSVAAGAASVAQLPRAPSAEHCTAASQPAPPEQQQQQQQRQQGQPPGVVAAATGSAQQTPAAALTRQPAAALQAASLPATAAAAAPEQSGERPPKRERHEAAPNGVPAVDVAPRMVSHRTWEPPLGVVLLEKDGRPLGDAFLPASGVDSKQAPALAAARANEVLFRAPGTPADEPLPAPHEPMLRGKPPALPYYPRVAAERQQQQEQLRSGGVPA